MEDRLMDFLINEKIEKEESYNAPDYLIRRIEGALNSLPERKAYSKFNYRLKVASIAIGILLLGSFSMTTQASNLLDSALKYIYPDVVTYDEEYKYSQKVEAKVVDKGIEVGVTEVLCDNNKLLIEYYIKNSMKFNDKTMGGGIFPKRYKLYIDGVEQKLFTSGSASRTTDYKTYFCEERIDISNLPSRFKLVWGIPNINNVDGKWNFEFDVDKESIDKQSKSIEVNKSMKIGDVLYNIEGINYTPLEMNIKVTGIAPKDYKPMNFSRKNSYSISGLIATDEKGNMLTNSRQFQSKEKDNQQIIDYKVNFKVKELPGEINVIPYVCRPNDNPKKEIYPLKGKDAFEINDSALGKFIISDINWTGNTLTFKVSAQLKNRIINLPDFHLEAFASSDIYYKINSAEAANALWRGEDVEYKFTGLKENVNYKLSYSNISDIYEFAEGNKINIPTN